MKYFQHPSAEVSKKAQVGKGTKIWHYVQIREGARIGENCIVGKEAYIDFNVTIGNNVKIQNRASIYHGTTIQDDVFIGPHVCFTNDKHPRSVNNKGSIRSKDDWKAGKILIKKGASIGAGSVLLPDITIGEYAMVGAGSVVTKDVPPFALAYGNPAQIHGKVRKDGSLVKKKGT